MAQTSPHISERPRDPYVRQISHYSNEGRRTSSAGALDDDIEVVCFGHEREIRARSAGIDGTFALGERIKRRME